MSASYKHQRDIPFLDAWFVFTMPDGTLATFQRESVYFSHAEDAAGFATDVQKEYQDEVFRCVQIKDEQTLLWLLEMEYAKIGKGENNED